MEGVWLSVCEGGMVKFTNSFITQRQLCQIPLPWFHAVGGGILSRDSDYETPPVMLCVIDYEEEVFVEVCRWHVVWGRRP